MIGRRIVEQQTAAFLDMHMYCQGYGTFLRTKGHHTLTFQTIFMSITARGCAVIVGNLAQRYSDTAARLAASSGGAPGPDEGDGKQRLRKARAGKRGGSPFDRGQYLLYPRPPYTLSGVGAREHDECRCEHPVDRLTRRIERLR
jgi:hypothetical protein